MNKSYGLFGLALETTANTAASAPTIAWEASADSDGIDISQSTSSVKLTSGARDTTVGSAVSGITATAKGTTIGFADFVGGLLYAALGKDTVTGTEAPYTHAITMGESLPSLTFFQQIGSSSAPVQTLAGSKVSKVEIDASGTTPPTFAYELAGCTAKWTPTTKFAKAFDPSVGWFTTAGAKVLFSLTSGTPAAIPVGVTLSELKVSIENSLTSSVNIGQVNASGQLEGAATVKVDLTGTTDSTDLYRQVKTGSSTGTDVATSIVTGSVQIVFPHTKQDGWSLTLTIPEVPWTCDAMSVSTDGGPFSLSLSTDGAINVDGSSITAQVVNDVKSYAA